MPAAKIHRAPRSVVGYHGCRRDVAERLVAGESWLPSDRDYDWLGIGVYFWEFAPFRALEWAHQKHSGDPAVLEARVKLGNCANFVDTEHVDALREAYRLLMDEAASKGEVLPKNRPDGRNFLDRAVVELFCELTTSVTGRALQTVRACYPEGAPVFPESRILTRTHSQIAVSDVSCITALRLVDFIR